MAKNLHRRRSNRALAKAVKRAGGQSALARELNIAQQTVYEWLNVSGKPTPELCPDIERITGVPCEELHPAFRRFAELRGLPQQKAAA